MISDTEIHKRKLTRGKCIKRRKVETSLRKPWLSSTVKDLSARLCRQSAELPNQIDKCSLGFRSLCCCCGPVVCGGLLHIAACCHVLLLHRRKESLSTQRMCLCQLHAILRASATLHNRLYLCCNCDQCIVVVDVYIVFVCIVKSIPFRRVADSQCFYGIKSVVRFASQWIRETMGPVAFMQPRRLSIDDKNW